MDNNFWVSGVSRSHHDPGLLLICGRSEMDIMRAYEALVVGSTPAVRTMPY